MADAADLVCPTPYVHVNSQLVCALVPKKASSVVYALRTQFSLSGAGASYAFTPVLVASNSFNVTVTAGPVSQLVTIETGLAGSSLQIALTGEDTLFFSLRS